MATRDPSLMPTLAALLLGQMQIKNRPRYNPNALRGMYHPRMPGTDAPNLPGGPPTPIVGDGSRHFDAPISRRPISSYIPGMVPPTGATTPGRIPGLPVPTNGGYIAPGPITNGPRPPGMTAPGPINYQRQRMLQTLAAIRLAAMKNQGAQ